MEPHVDRIATRIVNEVIGRTSSATDLIFFERWNDIVWQDLLGEATEVEFVASYMDTWIIQTSELLQGIFTRGGTVRAILPKPESGAAIRVLERFPEYTPDLVRHKIINTAQRLNMMAWQSGNKHAKSEIYWITAFCMHCLVRIDKKWLIISPFDHYRRGQIEGPALVVNLHRYRRLAEWAQKEFDWLQNSGEPWAPPAISSLPGTRC